MSANYANINNFFKKNFYLLNCSEHLSAGDFWELGCLFCAKCRWLEFPGECTRDCSRSHAHSLHVCHTFLTHSHTHVRTSTHPHSFALTRTNIHSLYVHYINLYTTCLSTSLSISLYSRLSILIRSYFYKRLRHARLSVKRTPSKRTRQVRICGKKIDALMNDVIVSDSSGLMISSLKLWHWSALYSLALITFSIRCHRDVKFGRRSIGTIARAAAWAWA